MKNLPSVVIIALFLSGCSVPENLSRAVVESNGYTEIDLKGPSLFPNCGKDKFSRVFVAKNAQGHRVKGVVRKGWVKGAAIRILSVY